MNVVMLSTNIFATASSVDPDQTASTKTCHSITTLNLRLFFFSMKKHTKKTVFNEEKKMSKHKMLL